MRTFTAAAAADDDHPDDVVVMAYALTRMTLHVNWWEVSDNAGNYSIGAFSHIHCPNTWRLSDIGCITYCASKQPAVGIGSPCQAACIMGIINMLQLTLGTVLGLFGYRHGCHDERQCLYWFAGGPYTGAALNPARVFGPALIFDCYWDTAFVYIFAELFGGFLAAVTVLPLYGFGQFGSLFDARVFGFLGLSVPHNLSQVGPADSCPSSRSKATATAHSRISEYGVTSRLPSRCLMPRVVPQNPHAIVHYALAPDHMLPYPLL